MVRGGISVDGRRGYVVIILNIVVNFSFINGGIIGYYLIFDNWNSWKGLNMDWVLEDIKELIIFKV